MPSRIRALVPLLLALPCLAAEPPLEPEAALAERLIGRAGLDGVLADLTARLAASAQDGAGLRLSAVRALQSAPLRLPGATRELARGLVGAKDLAATVPIAARWLDATVAPVRTEQAPIAPPPGSPVAAHVEHCLARMRRARDLVGLALSRLSDEERRALEADLPSLAAKFQEHIYLENDRDRARWRRHQRVIELLPRIDRAALVAALGELAPLADPAYLDRLAADLRAAEKAAGSLRWETTSELGAVIVTGSRADVHAHDAALVIDLGGDDRWTGPAAGARGAARTVAVAIDLGGDDAWEADGPFAQGAALLGAALLVERAGNDRYASAHPFAQGAAACGAAALVDLAGNDACTGLGYAQGSALAQGVGLLLDGAGDDAREAGLYAQGFAGPGGFGALVDRTGAPAKKRKKPKKGEPPAAPQPNDRYRVQGLRRDTYGDSGPDIWEGMSQGFACGFRHHLSGGIAVLVDDGGDDHYEAGNFSQGGAYYYAWGALVDLGAGRDRYDGARYAQAFGCHQALGSVWDEGGDDVWTSKVIAAQGLAWDLSVASFVDAAGDDTYRSNGTSQAASAHNGFVLFCDGGGRDSYANGQAAGLAGPNDYHGGKSLSVFLDLGGGDDAFQPAVAAGLTVSPEGAALIGDLPFALKGYRDRDVEGSFPKK